MQNYHVNIIFTWNVYVKIYRNLDHNVQFVNIKFLKTKLFRYMNNCLLNIKVFVQLLSVKIHSYIMINRYLIAKNVLNHGV